MASPLVAGVTALLLSRNAALTPDDVRGIIVQSADDVGWKGRINMESALRSGGTVFAVHNTGNTTLSVTNITPENGSPWLTVSETQLTIPAGESASIEVSVDFSNLSVGQHTDRLLIASNIPNQNPYPDGVYVIAELTNTDPSIISLTAAPNPVNEDETSQVSVIATDPDGHELNYSWSVSDGTISGTGSTVTYTPPDVNQQVAFIISVTVTDGFGGSDSTAMGIVVNPVGPTTVFGDADNDGQITAVDAAWVLEAVVGRRTTSSGDLVRCDVTGDGTCSALDAALILQFTVGIIPEFPVQSNSTTVAPGLHTTGTTYALHAEEIAAKRGEQVSLPIYLEKGGELLGGRFRIRYDSSLIAIHGVRRLDSEKMDKSNLLITQTDKPGNLIITFGRSEALKAGDLLATIDFELRPMVDKATAIVPFQIEDVVFNEGVALPVTFGEVRIIPGHTALFSNYPNPFNPETWIPYQLVPFSAPLEKGLVLW